MIQSVYYVVVYTSQGVPASVYRRVFSDNVTADFFAKRSLNPDRKEVYNTISFDGYFVRQFSITDTLMPLPF